MFARLLHKFREGVDPKGGHQGSSRIAGGRGALGHLYKRHEGHILLGNSYGKDKVLTGNAKLGHVNKQHFLLTAGSRSGKGTRILIPNILDYPGNSIIHDPKGESAIICAEALAKKGHKVLIIDPFDQCKTILGDDSLDQFKAAYNPFFDLNPFEQSSEIFFQSLSKVLVPDKEGASSDYWSAVNQQVAQGLMAWASVDWTDEQIAFSQSKRTDELTTYDKGYLAQYNNLIQVAFFSQQTDEYLHHLVNKMVNYKDDEKDGNFVGELIRNGGRNAQYLINREGDPQGFRSFLTTFGNDFQWAKNRAMKESLAGMDMKFSMRSFKTEEKMTVFVVVPKAYIPVVRPWLRMMFAMALNICEITPGKPKFPINLILDEAPQLGYMEEIKQAFAMAAGQGIRVWYVCQDFGQIQDIYGKSWESFVGSSSLMTVGCHDNTTTSYISAKIGKTYEKDEKTKSKGEKKVEIYTPDEIAKITDPDREIGLYLAGGKNPLQVRLVDYYKDRKRIAGRDYRVHPDHLPEGKKSPALLDRKALAGSNVVRLEDQTRRRTRTVKAKKAKAKAC